MGGATLIRKPEGVIRGRELLARTAAKPPEWSLDALAGRFVEIGGDASSAALTVAAGLALEAQCAGRLAAWIQAERSVFFPPDFEDFGIDLKSLPVIRVDDWMGAARAAETLIRSCAFALVVLDPPPKARLSLAAQTRFVGLTQSFHTTLVWLSPPLARAGNTLVSLRAETSKARGGADAFVCRVSAVKDKRHTPGWNHEDMCGGTDGLC